MIRSMSMNIRKNISLFIMISVPVLFCLVFKYFPMYGILMAFKKYDLITGMKGTPWVGFKYFIDFFNDIYCFRLIRNTLVLGTVNMAFGTICPIILALLLNEVKNARFKKTVQSISYLPHFISTVVIVGLFFEMINTGGIINTVLQNIFGTSLNYSTSPQLFVPIYTLLGVWQGVGYGSIVYMAALTNISEELYEASYVDGAGRWMQTVHITIPGILPTIIVILILNVGNIIHVSTEKVLLMYNPAIYETADVIQTYVYRIGIEGMNFSYSTSIDLMNSVISLILIIAVNYLSRKLTEESIW